MTNTIETIIHHCRPWYTNLAYQSYELDQQDFSPKFGQDILVPGTLAA